MSEQVIDIHAHVTSPSEAAGFQASLVASRGSPAGHLRRPEISDESIETALKPHLGRLADARIDHQFISPRPYGMMHSVRPEVVVHTWIGFVNDLISRQCQLHPGAFSGVAGLPQYRDVSPRNTLDELERCVRELGFVGCLLNPDPMEGDGPPPPGLGDKFWYPLYEKLVELDVPAMIHSASNASGRVPYTLHFINEESIAIIQLLESEVFKHFPQLKIIVPHGGGAIPYQVGRFRAWRLRAAEAEPFEESLRRLWFDTCNYSEAALELLVRVVGADRVLFGTEMPGTGSALDPVTGRMLDDLVPVIRELPSLSDVERAQILSGNARRLFREPVLAGALGRA